MSGPHARRAVVAPPLALLAFLVACAGGGALLPSGARSPERPSAAEPVEPAAHGRYGEEPRAEPTALERAAADAALARLAAAGTRPRTSPALALAARELAHRAASGDPDPLARARLRAALARALSPDPAPVAHLAVASPEDAARALADTLGRTTVAATHVGVGGEVRDGRAYLVLLAARRTAALRPFPRDVERGAAATLRGELVGLDHPTVHVMKPSGATGEVEARIAGSDFAAPIRFDAAGRWLVEVVGHGPRGPEVAALLTISCGGAALDDPASAGDEGDPRDASQAEARVASALNATRGAHGLPPLAPSLPLAAVARRHSEAMLERGVLAHVLPGSGDVGARLRAAHVSYALVLENVAMGASALAAHRGVEESPAHRENILSREATRVGCGVARGRLPTGQPIVYLTEIFVQPVEDGSEDRMTPEARVREAIWRERARLRAPPLLSDAALDALARDAAREMLRDGEPSAEHAGERALRLGRRLAAADAFVAAKAADATRSRNLPDARFKRVGVGVAIGDSRRYGTGLLWIAVIYSD